MRILVLWQYLFSYRVPFYQLLATMPGIELTVLHGGYRGGAELDPENNIYAFRSIQVRTRIHELHGAVLYFQTGIWRHILTSRYDAVVCEGNFGMITNFPIALYGRATRTRVYYWTAGWTRGRIRGLAARLRTKYIRLAARLPQGYLCYGTSARDFLVKYGVDPRRCTIVQNAIDCAIEPRDKQLATDAKVKLGLAGKQILLSVGQLRLTKRMDLLIDAFAELKPRHPDLALVIVGDGPAAPHLEEYVAQQGIPDVVFTGAVFADVGRYFSLADVFVLPGEGGLAINEAMAYGLPVICSEADGTERDLVLPGVTGVIFRRNDTGDLARAIEAVISSPETAKIMGEAARQHLRHVAFLPDVVTTFVHTLAEPTTRATYIAQSSPQRTSTTDNEGK